MMAVLYGETGQTDHALKLLEDVLAEVEKDGSLESELDFALIYQSVGNMYLSKKEEDKATEWWDRGIEFSVKKFGEESLQTLENYYEVAQSLIKRNKYQLSKKYVEENMRLSQKLYKENHPKVAESFLMSAAMNFFTHEFNKSLESYIKATDILSAYPDQYHEQLSFAYLTMAEIYLAKRKQTEARECFDKAMKIAKEKTGENSMRVAELNQFWGDQMKYKAKDFKTAVEYFTRAINIYKNLNKVDERRIVGLGYDIGILLFQLKNYEEALKQLNEILNLTLKSMPNERILVDIYNAIASIYFQRKKFTESIEYFNKAIETCLSSQSENKEVDIYYKNLGLAYSYSGQPEKAINSLRKAFDLGLKAHGKEDEKTQVYLHFLADELTKNYRYEEAEKLLNEYRVEKEK